MRENCLRENMKIKLEEDGDKTCHKGEVSVFATLTCCL